MYIFVKYSIKKLKLYAIILYISISWIASISLGIIPYFDAFGNYNNNGICDFKDASSTRSFVVATIVVQAFLFICIIIVFSLLTYCYAKKNTLQDNVEVKKVIVKNLLFLAVNFNLQCWSCFFLLYQ